MVFGSVLAPHEMHWGDFAVLPANFFRLVVWVQPENRDSKVTNKNLTWLVILSAVYEESG